jgi:hypothetical protein
MGVRRRARVWSALVSGLVVAGALTACASPSAEPRPSRTPAVNGSVPAPYRSLVDGARERGTVQVIVKLAIPYRPEGELADQDAIRRQRAEIETAQRRLLDELKPFRVQLVEQYRRLPQLALAVDDAAMRHLATSPLVASVQEDRPDSTTS